MNDLFVHVWTMFQSVDLVWPWGLGSVFVTPRTRALILLTRVDSQQTFCTRVGVQTLLAGFVRVSSWLNLAAEFETAGAEHAIGCTTEHT